MSHRSMSRLVGATLLSTLLVIGGCANTSAETAMVVAPQAPGEVWVGGDMVVTESNAERPVAVMPLPMPMPEMEEAGMADVGFAAGYAPAPTEVTDREIIMTGWAEIQADSPAGAATEISNYVESLGGHVASRREWQSSPGSPGGAELSLRIPAAQLNTVLTGLSGFGEVQSVSVESVDVTAQGADLDARISALQTSVTRLTELLATAAETADLLEVERELSMRQADLDALRASRATLSDQVAMSTLQVSIRATPTAEREAEPYPGFLGGIVRGWRAFVSFARGLAVVVGTVLPWLIAAGIVAALLTPLIRWLRSRAAKRTAKRRAKFVVQSGVGESRPIPVDDDYDD